MFSPDAVQIDSMVFVNVAAGRLQQSSVAQRFGIGELTIYTLFAGSIELTPV